MAVEGCETCPIGHACPLGTSTPERCAAGRYGSTLGQKSVECNGPCVQGHYCTEGSTGNTSGVCREFRSFACPQSSSSCVN
eukprot:4226077-Prymnesium_polylepis.1